MVKRKLAAILISVVMLFALFLMTGCGDGGGGSSSGSSTSGSVSGSSN